MRFFTCAFLIVLSSCATKTVVTIEDYRLIEGREFYTSEEVEPCTGEYSENSGTLSSRLICKYNVERSSKKGKLGIREISVAINDSKKNHDPVYLKKMHLYAFAVYAKLNNYPYFVIVSDHASGSGGCSEIFYDNGYSGTISGNRIDLNKSVRSSTICSTRASTTKAILIQNKSEISQGMFVYGYKNKLELYKDLYEFNDGMIERWPSGNHLMKKNEPPYKKIMVVDEIFSKLQIDPNISKKQLPFEIVKKPREYFSLGD